MKPKSHLICLLISCGLILVGVPAWSQQPDDSPTFKEGLQSYFRGDYEKARQSFQQAVDESPNKARYHFFLANTYNRLDSDTPAIRQYDMVLRQDTEHKTARKRLADLYYQKENWQEASNQYTHLASMESDNIEYRFRLAKSLFKLGKLDQSKSHFLKVRQRNPRRADVYYFLGRVLLRDGEYLNAISRFNRAVELNDSRGVFYFYRALAYFRQDDYLSDSTDGWKSASDFQRALDRGYKSPRAYFMLGNSLLNRGLFLLNENEIEKGIGLLKKSIRQYRQVLSGDWKASNAYHNMGVAYLGIGKLDLARKSIEEAILMEPTVPFFHDTLGDVYFEMGNFDKAIDSWELVQELDSSYDGSPFKNLLESRSINKKINGARIRR